MTMTTERMTILPTLIAKQTRSKRLQPNIVSSQNLRHAAAQIGGAAWRGQVTE